MQDAEFQNRLLFVKGIACIITGDQGFIVMKPAPPKKYTYRMGMHVR